MSYRSPMNKTMTIAVIALVAVGMGMSAVAPTFASHNNVPLAPAEDCLDPPGKVCVGIDRE